MTIIVTHRLETILGAQNLLLLEGGRIIARGNHHDLSHEAAYQEFLRHLH
jgi:ATP-binding cassette subfamily B protein